MINLSFKITNTAEERLSSANLESIPARNLEWDHFYAQIYFEVNGIHLDNGQMEVPVLYFSAVLSYIALSLSDGESDQFEFPESEFEIIFLRKEKSVTIAPSFSSSHAITTIGELQEAAIKFRQQVLNELMARWPKLRANSEYALFFGPPSHG